MDVMSTARLMPPAQIADAGVSLLDAAQQADITKLALVAVAFVVGAVVVIIQLVVGLSRTSREEMTRARAALEQQQTMTTNHHMDIVRSQGQIAKSLEVSGDKMAEALGAQADRFAEAMGRQAHQIADKIGQNTQGIRDMIETVQEANRINTQANQQTAAAMSVVRDVIDSVQKGHALLAERIQTAEQTTGNIVSGQKNVEAALNTMAASLDSFSKDIRELIRVQDAKSKKTAKPTALRQSIEKMTAKIDEFLSTVANLKEVKPDAVSIEPVPSGGADGAAAHPKPDDVRAGVGAGGVRHSDDLGHVIPRRHPLRDGEPFGLPRPQRL